MEKYRAIPEGYMTVGQVAKKLGTTVRTLQYYDREGLLKPTAQSEGGRRLYTDRDVAMLHQILSLKSLGFSLEDIRGRLVEPETPEQMARVLAEQEAAIGRQIDSLQATRAELRLLRQEVLQMQTVDFQRYAAIITNLQLKNDNYWLIKYMDEDTMHSIQDRFDMESARQITLQNRQLQERALALCEAGVAPDSPQGEQFAQDFWQMIQTFTGGDMTMLPSLVQMGSFASGPDRPDADSEDARIYARTGSFIGASLDAWFSKQPYNPFAFLSEAGAWEKETKHE